MSGEGGGIFGRTAGVFVDNRPGGRAGHFSHRRGAFVLYFSYFY